MITNPYATPSSSLEATETAPAAFYVVGKRKFLLLFLTTQGWFLLYWFYRNWKLYREATGTKVLPIVRAILGLFFVYSLFTRIDHHIHASGRRYSWYPRGIALAFILLSVVGTLQVWVLDLHLQMALAIVIMLLQTCCLCYVQNAINAGENDPEGSGNSALTYANVAWMLFGLCTWALAFAGFYSMLAQS